jgi:multidrug efflux pump subunit AcrA (membrane-fusion protein)
MRTAIVILLLLSTVAIGQEAPTRYPATVVDPVLEKCTVKVKEELFLPAKDAGHLVNLGVELGDIVKQNDILAQIDDSEAVAAQKVAEAQWHVAELNAGEGSKIQIEFAQDAANLAENEYRKLQQVARERAVTEWDLERAKLEWVKSQAQVKVRVLEKSLAEHEITAKGAELEAANKAVERRQLKAPFDGIVVERFRRQGEWVQAGEPILRLMNFQTMVVSGKVSSDLYRRQDVAGKQVTVEVQLARGERLEFPGKITYVSPITDSLNQEFAVEAEVANQVAGNHWLLPHGETVRMTIHVN